MRGKEISERLRKTAVLQVFALFVLVVAATVPVFGAEQQEDDALRRVQEVYQYLERYHVSGIDREELADQAIEGMIEALDGSPHAIFDPEEYEAFTSSINREYVGIGIRVGNEEDGFIVAEVFADSPAETAGMKAGDRIIAVEGESVDDWNLDQLVSRIKGPEGTSVNIRVRRQEQTLDLQVSRRPIQLPVVTTKWLDGNIGYVEFSTFSNEAEKRFGEELEKMKERGLQGLVIDLRGNPGGYLHVAARMLKHFVPEGTLVHTHNRDGETRAETFSGGTSLSVPVVLLVDEYSASASEVFAGAMQDYNKAVLVGTKTYGKGSVQQMFTLSDGSYIKITIEEYLTPKKRKVNGVGLQPDAKVYGEAAQLMAALRLSGVSEVGMTLRDGEEEWSLNGATWRKTFDWFRNEDGVYLPSRLLAALTGSEISWNAENRTVEFSRNGEVLTFSADGADVLMNEGVTYIELDAFRSRVPELGVFYTDTEVRLRIPVKQTERQLRQAG